MQNPDQFPQQPEKPETQYEADPASQPLYEFPISYAPLLDASQEAVHKKVATDEPGNSATQQSPLETHALHKPEDDLIRQGLVYPPPPSFYQQTQMPHPLPPPTYLNTDGRTQLPPPVGYHGPQPPFAPIPPAQPQTKKSYKWLWITISIVAVLLLASCGICGWAFSQFITPIIQSETNAINTTNEYYAALQNKDYADAYQYLSPQGSIQGMTLATFTQHAQNADNQYGTIRSYTTGSVGTVTDPNNAFSFSRFTIGLNITRTHKTYNVSLTVTKLGNNWKITDFDSI